MDKNNRVLIAVILLIFVTLLSFNLTSITGSSTKDKIPSVTVNTKVIRAGERVTVSVWTGKLGMSEKACLYDRDGNRISCTNSACDSIPKSSYKCFSSKETGPLSFTFNPSTSLDPGDYDICVWDYELAKIKLRAGDYTQRRGYVCGDFTIKE